MCTCFFFLAFFYVSTKKQPKLKRTTPSGRQWGLRSRWSKSDIQSFASLCISEAMSPFLARQLLLFQTTDLKERGKNAARQFRVSSACVWTGRKAEYPEETRTDTEENVQTQPGKALGRDSSSAPSCCEATVLTTAQSFHMTPFHESHFVGVYFSQLHQKAFEWVTFSHKIKST
ncbi:hypothetical protein SKAU_G00379470 [Synaphobranchus kaupii]|uniref:Uncharacterized protein n=1 Tax=Synaphobranchus kaupii TaxID=118154 RepID=A0A9Q1EDC5_SYNKA|nr:hypothetical protein SKAU_G00379470 [Synaphobranchus kaupii]